MPVPTFTTKWVHGSGFTLEKLEIGKDGTIKTETSLVKTLPGLKLEFKGDTKDKANLSFSYKIPTATFTGELDVNNFSKLTAAAVSGFGKITGGISFDFSIPKKELTGAEVSASVKEGPSFLAAKVNKGFEYSAFGSHVLSDQVTLAAKLAQTNKGGFAAYLAAIYKCNPKTIIKVKVDNQFSLNASVKQSLEKKLTLTGTAAIPGSFDSVKLGVLASLG